MPRRGRVKDKPRDLYGIFGMRADAPDADLRKHYRKLCLEHHPDKVSAERREAATAKLAEINAAWDTLGDPERRRVYDMQREADGLGSGRRGGFGSLLRSALVGGGARTFAWSGPLPYLRDRHVPRLARHLERNKPALLFLHLGGSPRAARSADAMLETHHRLRGGGALIAAIDVEASPMLARSLRAEGSQLELPAVVLFTSRDGVRYFEPPLNSTELIGATVKAMPGLQSLCTAKQYRQMLGVASGGGRAGLPHMAIAVAVRRDVRPALRSACAAHSTVICAHVPSIKCDLPPAVLDCPGTSLIDAWRPETPARCISKPEQLVHALRVHAARARYGPRRGAALGRASVAYDVVSGQPPLRAASAISAALSDGAIARTALRIISPMVGVVLGAGQAPLILAALGVMVWQLQAVLLRGFWWGSRGGGRRLGGRRRSRPWK